MSETTNSSQTPEKKKAGKTTAIIIIAIIMFFMLCICGACGFFATKIDWNQYVNTDTTTDTNTSDNTSDTSEVSQDKTYLGYEKIPVNFADLQDLNNELFTLYDNLETLSYYEEYMYTAAQSSDANTFFDSYRGFNETMGIIMGEVEGISEYFGGQAVLSENQGFHLVAKTYAKERSSWKYWIPIYGSLLKAKHQSIETSRAGIYNYLKNDLDDVDRQEFLDTYNLDSVEDLRNASDTVVESLARDPELNGSIDWAKVTQDLGENAVQATVDGIKLATGGSIPNPAQEVAKNAVVDIIDGEIEKVNDPLPPVEDSQEPEARVSFGTRWITKNIVDKALENAGTSIEYINSWEDIPESTQEEITTKITNEVNNSGPIAVSYKPSEMEDKNAIQTRPGTWDFIATTINSVPIEINDVILKAEKVTELIKPTLDITQYIGIDLDSLNINTTALENKTEITVTENAPNPDWWDGTYASCPFLYIKKDGNWIVENDLISVARALTIQPTEVQKTKAYTDYMTLTNLPDVTDNKYSFRIQEVRDEVSHIDQLSVISVDHSTDVSVGVDLDGNIVGYNKSELVAVDDASQYLGKWDESAKRIYHGDVLDFDFSSAKPSENVVIVVSLDGFEGESITNTFERPRLVFQTKDSTGNWVDRETIYPREYYSDYAFSAQGWFEESTEIRILVYSCHLEKYQRLDFLGIDPDGATENLEVSTLPISVTMNTLNDQSIIDRLSKIDGDEVVMPTNSWFILEAKIESKPKENRTLIIQTTGYYVAE